MSGLFVFLLILEAVVATLLVTVILMQRSEGGGLGMGGSPSGLMSARGAADFLTRATAILATIFVLLSILLAGLATQTGGSKPIDQSLVRQAPTSAPPGPGESAPISGGVPVVPAPADTAPAGGVPFQTAPAQPAPSAPASSAPASSQSSLDQSDHGQPDSGQSGTDQAGPKNGAAATAPKDPDRRFANERFTRPPAPAEPAP